MIHAHMTVFDTSIGSKAILAEMGLGTPAGKLACAAAPILAPTDLAQTQTN